MNIEQKAAELIPENYSTPLLTAAKREGAFLMAKHILQCPSELGMVKKEDVDESIASIKENIRLMDVAMFGNQAAKSPSGCDVLKSVQRLKLHADQLADKLEEWIEAYNNKEDMSDLYEESALLVIKIQEPNHYPTENEQTTHVHVHVQEEYDASKTN
jgi:hypothetical protein